MFDKIIDMSEQMKIENKAHKRKTTVVLDAKMVASLAPDSPLLKGRALDTTDSEEDPVVAMRSLRSPGLRGSKPKLNES